MADPRIVPVPLLHKLLRYDADTGYLWWKARDVSQFSGKRLESRCKTWNTRYANARALAHDAGDGHLQGSVLNVRFWAHRVAWAMFHGEWPDEVIDHINGRGDDNRITNLRSVSQAINLRNRVCVAGVSGETGVYPKGKRWCAKGGIDGRDVQIGIFDTIEEAAAARFRWSMENGFTERHHAGAASAYQGPR